MKRLLVPVMTLAAICTSTAQTPCENGMAGDYPCNQVILHSHLTITELLGSGVEANDIWGWEDPMTQKEYAIIGMEDGVTFVDITDPNSPTVIGKLEENHSNSRVLHESAWRDIKVYNDHAFVVSDLNGADHGMQIFDLTRLRDFDGATAQFFTHDALYSGIGSAHNVVINEETGYAYIVGTSSGAETCGAGGLHIVNIQDPMNPTYEACFDDDGYTHDGQCVSYQGPDSDYTGQEICFNSNENTFTIVNVEDKSNMSIISRNSYAQVRYTHQGWLTEDHRFFLQNDELDESAFGFNPRTLIWDVQDLDNPILLGEFYNEAVSIDHNLYTHQGLVFESNYTSGLRILSADRVEEGLLREVAYFDCEPQGDAIAFAGTWSNYPYFESGSIAISDMRNGLFVISLDIVDIITQHPQDVVGAEGSTATMTLETSGTISEYQWQLWNNTARSFRAIDEDQTYSGVTTATLSINLTEDVEGATIRVKLVSDDGRSYYSYPAIIDVEGVVAPPALGTSEDLEAVTVYPNPTTDFIHIDVNEIGEYQLFDVSGSLMQQGIVGPAGNTISVASLKSGQYFVRVQVDGKQTVHRLIKE